MLNVFKQAQLSEFEYQIYNNTLSQEEINDCYVKTNIIYYGDDVNCDDLISYEWCRFSSLYMDFYTFQYITSFGAAMNLYGRLSDCDYQINIGRFDPPLQNMNNFGINFEDEQMYNSLFSKLNDLLESIELY